jgi:dGTP triphosphohydrolase
MGACSVHGCEHAGSARNEVGSGFNFPFAVGDQFEPDVANLQPSPRIIADYIAGMIERHAREMYLRLAGIASGSALH